MFNNASNIDASHSTFSEVHRDQHVYQGTRVQGDYTVNTIIHGNQVFHGTLGLENLHRASVPSAAFDSIDRHPAPACLPGTRLELLARLMKWVDDPKCDQCICWLSGPAGSGKSAVAQSMAEVYAGRRRLAASFFFSRKEMLRRKAHGFFPTLACQVLAFAPSIKPALVNLLDADATIPTKVLLEQAYQLLREPISSSMTFFPDPILIVIDSLDECDDVTTAKEIVHLLGGILRRCRWPLKVLITSRPEPHIVQTFHHPELRDMTCSLRLQEFGVDNDIRAYLRHSFEGIQESMDAISVINFPLPWPSKDEIEMIVKKAAGLFIFATTVIKYVSLDYHSPVMQLQAVLRVLQGCATEDSALVHSPLDSLYLDVLRVVQDREKVHLILGSVVFAFQPLSTRGLNDLLWKSRFDPSYVVKSLLSVLTISDSDDGSNGTIHVYHTSFHDFLTTSHRSQEYFVDPCDFHSMLAHACLELMGRHLRADMCNLGDPSTLNCEISDLDKRCKLCITEGVRYACRWFSHHLSQVPCDRRTDNALVLILQEFANRYLLNWLEVLSLTGQLDTAVVSLREVVDWLKRLPNPSGETLSLFHDAERLVLMCYDSIQQAALQVYYSIPLVPASVQIRTSYAHELKDKFVITYGLGDHWNPCVRSVATGTSIKSLAVSASGRLIASAGDIPGVQLWDMLTGSNIGHCHGNGTSTCPVIFSPSKDYVAIGYDTGAIDVWDVTTGKESLGPSQDPHNASVSALAFSWNGRFVASGAADGTVHIWNLSAKSLQHTLAYHQGPIMCLLFSFRDELIASGSSDKSMVTSSVITGQLARRFQGHASQVNTISFLHDDQSLATGSDDQSVRLWDTRTGVCLRTFAGSHGKPIRHVWFTADGEYVVSVCNMDIYLWKTRSSNQRPAQHIWSVNHYTRKAATMFPAWYAKFTRFVPKSLFGRLAETDDGTVLYTAPSPDGRATACAYGSSVLFLDRFGPPNSLSRLRNPLTTSSTLDRSPISAGSDDISTAIAMTRDSSLLVTSGKSGILKIWSASTQSSWKAFEKAFKAAADGFWSTPDGHSLLVKPMAGLQLVSTTSASTKSLDTGWDMLGSVGAISSPDSRYFAYWAEYAWNVDNSFSIHIYDATTGVRLQRIPGLFKITCGRFSEESDLFACAHGDGAVQLWELPSALCKTTIMTGHAAITGLELLPGNVTVVVGSDKGCVEIRMVEDGTVLHRVTCSSSSVLSLAVPNDALIVVVGQEDGSIFVWDPSYTDATPHCLWPRVSQETTLDGAVCDPDGIDFIKFTSNYRTVCTRSTKGVVCTWNLTYCLAGYAEHTEKESSVENDSGADTLTTTISTQPSDLPAAPDSSDGSLDSLGARDEAVAPTDTAPVAFPSELAPPTDASEPEGRAFPILTNDSTPSDPQTLCPHLVSRSDASMVYDRYLRTTYAVDAKRGWVYHGPKRIFWLPNDLRPASPIALSASEGKLIVLTRSESIVFFDLRSMLALSS